jgi:hypothetical protein
MPPLSKDVPNYVAGVCSDYIERYKWLGFSWYW